VALSVSKRLTVSLMKCKNLPNLPSLPKYIDIVHFNLLFLQQQEHVGGHWAMASTPPYTNRPPTGTGNHYHISQQQTIPAVPVPSAPAVDEANPNADEVSSTKPKLTFNHI